MKGLGYFMWDLLLPTPEDSVDATSRDLITKYYITRTEYRRRPRTKMVVYEIPVYILREHLAVYLMQYDQLVNVIPEYETGDWGVELVVDREVFTFIPTSLGIGGRITPST